MSNMLNIGMSGIYASQAALNVTSNNIANAAVPGYSRQQVMLESSMHGPYGGGVSVTGVRRIADQYLVEQVWTSQTTASYYETQASYYGQVEQVFGADGSNISTGLDSLFAALNASLLAPDDIATRQAVLNEASNLSLRFNSIDDGLQTQLNQIESQMGASVSQANVYLNQISRLNAEVKSFGGLDGTPPELLDERDNAIAELSKLMDVTVTDNADGTINLSLQQGQPLVVGTSAAELKYSPDPTNPEIGQVSLDFGDQKFPLNDEMGGSMGALLEYRDDSLAESQKFIDELAVAIADEMNAVFAAGTDLNGNPPTLDLFTYDPSNPAGTLKVSDGFTADMLAFGKDGTPGDNSNLQDAIDLANKPIHFASLGVDATMGQAYATKLGQLGSESAQAKMDAQSSGQSLLRAQTEWASSSGVNLDEEAVNLIVYQQAYQANSKVISTADQLFQSVLNAF
ncbi:flagellar hook-associated protein FlgK [Ferrimonas aestuarii]|uniref:Flagellar hook-associated protein 1 n=1 Tax=Ferrimonas aestuarii TaxID=2569539 RepID=A0A4U1BM92_9GAMM|nr:flagellar hook-associated protein FlgK [Ferrimonas aestuarii]TKB54587.1 flagellar hook-associated protein FlgK [Ferrimonas aestuarii]